MRTSSPGHFLNRLFLSIVLMLIGGIFLLVGCNQEDAVTLARNYQQYQATFVNDPPASSIFPTDDKKWYPLEIGNGTAVGPEGKRTWRVELRGWLSVVATECNTADPDWHYLLEIDPDWADSVGMPVAQLLRAGNFVGNVTDEQTGDKKARTTVGVPNVMVELNGYVPAVLDGKSAPSSWNPFGKDCPVGNENTFWAFDPARPLAWQEPLKVGDYVRMYGALVTDGPHTGEGFFEEFFCRQFSLKAACLMGDTEYHLALLRWAGGRSDDDPTNPARWTEMHPPDIIAILPPKAHTTNMRSVAVSAENCLIGPCEKTTLDVDIAAPQPKPANATGITFREEVVSSTNYRTIIDGHKNATGDFDGATVTMTATGIHVHVSVQGQPGYGAPGRFGAFYRVSWTTP